MKGLGLGRFALATTVLLAACGGTTPPTSSGPTAAPATAGAGPTAGTGQGTSAPQTIVPAATTTGNQGGPGSGFTGDPCALLTATEIERVTGVTNSVGNSTPMSDDKGACLWVGDDTTMGAGIEIATGARAVSNWDTAKNDSGSEALSGIGDEAVYNSTLESVFFLKNGVLFAVLAGPFFSESDTKKASAIELSKIVLGKL